MKSNSNLFSINFKEIVRGLVVSTSGAVITALYTGIESGVTIFDVNWTAVGNAALLAGLAYISQKILRNSNDELLKKDK